MKKTVRYEKITNTDESEFIKKYNYYIIKKNLIAGETHLFHWHDYYELEILLNGCATHIFGNEEKKLDRGSAYLITPSEYHSLKIHENSCILNFRFIENFFSEKIADHLFLMRNADCQLSEADTAYIEDRIKRINSLDIRSEFYHDSVQSILTEIIILFFEKTKNKKSEAVTSTLIQKTVDYINKNFRHNITLRSVADKMSVTPKYLGNVFKNINFNDYLNRLRLKYACSLLKSSDLSVKEIAYSSGYNSEQYFLYIFKKYMNTTPSSYREKNLSERFY